MVIRSAVTEDAGRLLEIYAYYVEHTAISYEYVVPSLEEFQQRIHNTLEKYPYLVIEEDGVIKGYTYAAAFIQRAAYGHCCEVTIYLDRDSKRNGYGRALYEELEAELQKIGITNLYACVGDPIVEDEYLTKNSEHFHQHMGYTKVGEFHKCGYKFGRFYNMIWMEKIIGKETNKFVSYKNKEISKMKVYCYFKCTTCKKALKWLEDHEVTYEVIDIKENHPDEKTLRQLHKKSGLPLKRFFNTSGMLYREMGLSKKLPDMSEDEMYELLASDGMLVRRPLLITENQVFTGFKEAEWKEAIEGEMRQNVEKG